MLQVDVTFKGDARNAFGISHLGAIPNRASWQNSACTKCAQPVHYGA